MTRFWASFVESSEDCRPLTYPPNEAILGWWKSGEDADGHAVLCLAIQADNEKAAREAVGLDWPGKYQWRLLHEKTPDWILESDRFPLSDWMKERFHKPASPTKEGE